MEPCPKCGSGTEMGFGLAGGGYGPYRYCLTCEEIIEKWQDDDGQPSEQQEWRDLPFGSDDMIEGSEL